MAEQKEKGSATSRGVEAAFWRWLDEGAPHVPRLFREGIENGFFYWRESSPFSVPDLIREGAASAMRSWLDDHRAEIVAEIARAARPDDPPAGAMSPTS